ncbi:MAG TPA: hypothetical protein VFX55_09125 [Duganella sp.]|nr:hypothetical protein [Duganella sp.]
MPTPSWRRRGWLALIGAAHLLALMCWKAPERPLAAAITPHAPVTYILTPFRPLRPPAPPESAVRLTQPPPRAAATRPAGTVTALPRPSAEPQAITAAPPPAMAESESVTLPTDPFAVAVKPQDDLKQRALKGALAADQQARKDAWTQRDRKYVNAETALASAIGSAYNDRSSGAIGEFTAPDGSRVTKWRMSDGTVVCYYAASNNFAGGRDPFRDTGRISVRECPK